MDEQSIFLEALKKETPDERAGFLDKACGTDEAIRQEVKMLLRAHEKAGDFLQGTPAGIEKTINHPIAEKPGDTIGPFKLLEQIGEGGMGVVYMAEQTKPLNRRVALKIIKPGMDTRQVIGRFEAERQALAMMDHPNIAKVLDAGTTDSGRPYFVMELVKGIPITEYCDKRHLTPRQRLELLIPVCQAVQHAHQKGIIHRDIKPSNVMVAHYDDRAVPKIIDFGVAKAVEQQLTENTVFTQFGQVVGTIEYMSPEQARLNQLDVDTRSDIYSLGVLLYELLTGDTPFDGERLHSVAFDELLQIIREEDPPRPSLRLSTSDSLPEVASNRQVEPKLLSALVRGELDWIVMKALDKDRTRRYETANGFANDIQRYLDDEPVNARPPSSIYMLGKFTRRNKGWLSTAAALLMTVFVGLAVSTILIAKERDAAEESAEREAVAADRADRQFRAARDAVDRMLTTAASELVNVPHSGAVRRKLLEDALEFYEGFLEQKSDDPIIRHETSGAYRRVGRIRRDLGDRTSARKAYREASELLEGLVDEFPQEATYKKDLAWCVAALGHLDIFRNDEEDLRTSQRFLTLSEELVAEHPAHPEYRRMVARGHTYVGNGLFRVGRLPEALPHFRQALVEWKQLYKDHPQLSQDPDTLALIHHWLGNALIAANQLAEAEVELRQAHTLYEELLEAYPESRTNGFELARFKPNMAKLRRAQGRPEEAEDFLRQGIEIFEELVDDFPTDTEYRSFLADFFGRLAQTLAASGRGEEAQQALQTSIEHLEKLVAAAPEDSWFVSRLSKSYFELGLRRYEADEFDEEAAQAFRRIRELYESQLEDHADDHRIVEKLAKFLVSCPADQFQDPASAIQLVKPLLQESPRDGDLWGTLGAAYHAAGEWQKAIDALEKANTLKGGSEPRNLFLLAMSQWQLGQRDEARQSYDQAIEYMETHKSTGRILAFMRAKAAEVLGVADEEPADTAPPDPETQREDGETASGDTNEQTPEDNN